MIILGIDPGPTEHGMAWIEVTADARRLNGAQCHAHQYALEHIGRMDIVSALSREMGIEVLVCIEVPEQVHPSRSMSKAAAIARGTQLVKTLERVADLRVACERAGVPCVTMACREARRAMGVRGAKPDAATAVVLQRLVSGWPRRSNAHVRDAAIVALAGVEKWKREGAK